MMWAELSTSIHGNMEGPFSAMKHGSCIWMAAGARLVNPWSIGAIPIGGSLQFRAAKRRVGRQFDMSDVLITVAFSACFICHEISVQLLEEGVGSFEVLQRSLPSIVLCRVEKLDEECTSERLIKMFRIAQLQIEYILKSQAQLADKIDELQNRQKTTELENMKLRREMSNAPEKVDSLFKCDKCEKLFLRSCFLCDHIRRRHKEGEFSDADNLAWK